MTGNFLDVLILLSWEVWVTNMRAHKQMNTQTLQLID